MHCIESGCLDRCTGEEEEGGGFLLQNPTSFLLVWKLMVSSSSESSSLDSSLNTALRRSSIVLHLSLNNWNFFKEYFHWMEFVDSLRTVEGFLAGVVGIEGEVRLGVRDLEEVSLEGVSKFLRVFPEGVIRWLLDWSFSKRSSFRINEVFLEKKRLPDGDKAFATLGVEGLCLFAGRIGVTKHTLTSQERI